MIEPLNREEALSDLLRCLGARIDAIAEHEAKAAKDGAQAVSNTKEKRRLIEQMDKIVDQLTDMCVPKGK